MTHTTPFAYTIPYPVSHTTLKLLDGLVSIAIHKRDLCPAAANAANMRFANIKHPTFENNAS
jgi:hypothetical protein